MRARFASCCALGFGIWVSIAFGGSRASASIAFDTVALSSTAAPGTVSGTNFTGFDPPAIDPSGNVAFFAFLSSSTATDTGIWDGTPGSLSLIAQKGSAAPGTAFNYSSVDDPVANDNGTVGFEAGIGTGSSTSNFGVFSGQAGSVGLIAQKGSVAAGTTGATYSSIGSGIAMNSSGQVEFSSTLLNGDVSGTTNNFGLWSGSPGSVSLEARKGSPAPGTSSNYSGLSATVSVNASDQISLEGGLSGGGSGFFVGAPGSVSLLAQTGSAAPGTTAATFSGLSSVTDINSSGQVAFEAGLAGGDTTTANNSGIWLGSSPSTLTLVARKNDPAPGTGDTFSFLNNPLTNSAGQVAFTANILTGGSVTTANDTGLWVGAPGSLNLLARTGNQAPGTISGDTFATIGSPTLNSTGAAAFIGTIAGTDASAGTNTALWAGAPGNLQLIARTGSLFDVDPADPGTDLRTVSLIGLDTGSGGSDGWESSYNSAGTLAFSLEFTDGSSGVFTAMLPVPEPGTFALFAGGVLLISRKRIRRAI
jgi:hypothetical protein